MAQSKKADAKDFEPGPYVAHGSEQHAQMLGLRRATAEDRFVHEKWTLADLTAYGPTAREDFLMAVLIQKVNELTTPPPTPQSKNRNKPGYAPPMDLPPGVTMASLKTAAPAAEAED